MAKRTANTLSIMEVFAPCSPTESDAVKWFEEVRLAYGTPTCTHCGNTEHLTRPKTRPDAYWCPACQQRYHRPHGHRDGILSHPAPKMGRGNVLHA